ncbi:hypothetical protein PENARI_c005G01834 [Penicillium arizonense]|uniref:F-box domain-containing protein n=1 Tax=Penicillium arizonense TaxID=1835702 RepID=A0A1F5LPQ0_PENAI|nr:hypothetical protein PENARI_c005G01834 [Penicillium arizonense]OGE55000.1 hypothetical protein PENARI_c005G01834 [Penicillium arizonense]
MFDDLPPEILHLVACDLRGEDLYHLVSSSRRLHIVFQQCLYTNVSICGWEPYDGIDQSAQIFLYAVTRTPRLASYVRSLKVECWVREIADADVWKGERAYRNIEFDGNLVRKLVSERTGYSEEERSKWLKELEQDNRDAWLALLIPQLKQLRRIRLTWPPYSSHYVLDMLQKAALEEESLFPYLEEAYGVWGNSENAFPSYQMQPFFKFPSMREVCCSMMTEYDNGDYSEFAKRDTLSPQCSNITDIDLQECNSVVGMREWVHACKALKSFRFIHGSRIVSNDDFQPRKIYESLSFHMSTLEFIWVEAHDGTIHLDTDDEWMGNFADFTVLKLICTSLPNLLGLDEHNLLL